MMTTILPYLYWLDNFAKYYNASGGLCSLSALCRWFIFVSCNGRGSLAYQRSLYCFTIMLRYWTLHQLPVIKLLQANHTLFSEESGEIALSVLSTSQPINNRTKIDQARKAWQFVRTRYDLHKSVDGSFSMKKNRRILSK